jgi:hypothetical protein
MLNESPAPLIEGDPPLARREDHADLEGENQDEI